MAPRPESLSAFGAGKVILLGEHSVVYGHPALAGPLSQGVTARAVPAKACQLALPSTLSRPQRAQLTAAFARAAEVTGAPPVKVSLEADLPLAVGLGSSAALSVACARLLLQAAGKVPTPKDAARVAWAMEQEFHGTPSGVDHTTSAAEQLVLYWRKPGAAKGTGQVVESPRPLHVVVTLAGERSPTKKTVGALRERQARWPSRYERLFAEIGRVSSEGAKAVAAGDLEALGDAMNVNQGLLAALGLSSPPLEEMVYRLRELGALGAKLTGAGGDGGAVIGLFLEPKPVVTKLTRMGVRCFSSQLAGPRAS
ncbi:mevalonate kinase [Myxococcus xanthus DK 1622]|uniref:mevalonate kinase n=2 Tax=Myxococcus TaxID=32 RepID=Q1D2E9_MYXXD|nr:MULTISPECIES: mevalonate kinase [Myxococcus]ABF90439.1 mevalonate kinase [Myxococcus xanthus DK 1622]NOJ56385.1 mevalonate kinase [Myxococcus xanthus]QPM77535.1 mevalonate kinase [Myxococcus xanthus]QQR42405.1 mevalonate kinase [Myxococcus xanthus]QVW66602.1 mevalonate kinase [Myxococcus xanthus DZ2]